MDATAYVLLLAILRLVIPFGLILGLGEVIRQRNTKYWLNT